MSKPLIQSVAVSILCLLTAASPALAKKKHHHYYGSTGQSARLNDGYGSTSPYPSYTTAAAQAIVGHYTSQDFYPNPLVLDITGMDAAGNLSGSMWAISAKPQDGINPAYDKWTRVFGQNARAVYRNGQIVITFSNGATYTLTPS